MELLWARLVAEWAELKKAPRLLALTFLLGLVSGWAAVNLLHQERFAILEAQLNSAAPNHAVAGQPSATEFLLVFTKWRGPCAADFNGDVVARFMDSYDVALVCQVIDSGHDPMTTPNLTVSPHFTIHPGAIAIDTPLSEATRAAIKGRFIQMGTADMMPANAAISLTMKFFAVLIPKQLEVSRLERLADVSALGGKLLTDRGLDMQFFRGQIW